MDDNAMEDYLLKEFLSNRSAPKTLRSVVRWYSELEEKHGPFETFEQFERAFLSEREKLTDALSTVNSHAPQWRDVSANYRGEPRQRTSFELRLPHGVLIVVTRKVYDPDNWYVSFPPFIHDKTLPLSEYGEAEAKDWLLKSAINHLNHTHQALTRMERACREEP